MGLCKTYKCGDGSDRTKFLKTWDGEKKSNKEKKKSLIWENF